MYQVNQKYISIPIVGRMSFALDKSIYPSGSFYKEMKIDQFLLKEACLKAIALHRYKQQFDHDEGIIIIGKDTLERISNLKAEDIPDTFHQDLSNIKLDSHYIILNASTVGTIVLPIPRALQADHIKRQLTDRERLSTAHIQAVTKVVAEQGNQQRGEYADGWMACIRVMCQNLGVEIPENIKIPFQGMHVNDLTAKILEEMKSSV
jgi:hypothetical protein